MTAVTDWIRFGAAAVLAGAGLAWGSPSDALSPDAPTAEATSGPMGTLHGSTQTRKLRCSGPDITGVLPGEFLLVGVEIRVIGRWSGAGSGVRTVPLEVVVGEDVRHTTGSVTIAVGGSTTVIIGGPTSTLGLASTDITSAMAAQIYGDSTTTDASGNTLHIDSIMARFYWSPTKAVVAEIADAVVAQINAGAYPLAFTASRVPLPRFDLSKAGTAIKVCVLPGTVETSAASRVLSQYEIAVEVGVQRRIGMTTNADLDEMLAIVEAIGDQLRMRDLAGYPVATFSGFANEPVMDWEHLEQHGVFTSLMTVTYRLAR